MHNARSFDSTSYLAMKITQLRYASVTQMAGKSQPMSTFAIRFNPASVADDDDDDELYGIANTRPRKEALQFERRSASPQPSVDAPVNPAETSSDAGVAGAEQTPALHPSTLWKSPMHAARSAPVSETTSPVSPLKTNAPSESDKSVPNRDLRAQGAAKDDSQRSIFSELRERIVNQSREMLPKRLNKTGSNDTAKIVMGQADDDKTEKETTRGSRGHSRPGSDGGEAIAKEILKAGSTECVSGDWEKPSDREELSVRKSLSAGQIASKQEPSADSEHQTASDVTTTSSSLFPASAVSMSELLSNDGSESSDVVAPEVASDAPAPPESVVPSKSRKSLSYFSRRIKRVKTVLRVPAFLKTQTVVALLIVFLAVLILPLPPFLSGFVTGSFFMALIAAVVYNGFLAPARVKEVPPLRDLKLLPPLQVPEMKESKNMDGLFKGWMNELSDYDVNNYHINETHSIFVTLEGSTMRLQTPKQGIAKRAMSDESIPTTVSFVRQKHYDLRGCEVTLLPADLIEKRLWSKKYPICIEVSKRPVASDPLDRASRELSKRNLLQRMDGDFPDSKSSPASVTRATKSHVKHLFLFARSSREKEEWFRRFVAAAAETPWPTRMSDLLQKKPGSSPTLLKSHVRNGSASSLDQQLPQHKRHGSMDSQCSSISWESLPSPETDYARLAPEKNLVEYMTYMAKIMPASEAGTKAPSASSTLSTTDELCDAQLLWLNAIISRCFLDFLREKYWTNKIRDKIQKKLEKMHVPHFIDQLTVTGIELGSQVPVIYRTSKPYLDDRGLWVDMDVSYGGGFGITMETKCNLMKLKSTPSIVREEKSNAEKRSGALYSDEEDSAESTTDEEAVEENTTEGDANSDKRSEPMSKKLLKFVDKISKSRYFQQATDYRYIKKAMEEVSNTRLVLNVEMKAVNGTLAVNIPPPPTNRIWYGFRGNPNLVLSAKPRVGEREVSLSHITDWIEKKLAIEFQRVFVMPNMDDIPISLMCEHLPPTQVTTTTV